MTKKKSNDEFLEEVYQLVGNEYTFLDKYLSTNIKIKCRHNKCGHEYFISPNMFLNKKNRCPKCFKITKKSNDEFLKEVYQLVGNEYTFLEEYVSANYAIKVIHNICGNTYKVNPSHFLGGRKCAKCLGLKKKSNDEFLKEVFSIVGNEYTFLEEYINSETKLKVRHNKCGYEYKTSPHNFMESRCPKCADIIRGLSTRKSNDEFLEEVYQLVGNEYTFLEEYINSETKLKVRHNKCRYEYFISPNMFLNKKNRCPKCNKSIRWNNDSFLKEVYKLVGNEYSFLEEYKINNQLIRVRHNKCGYEYSVGGGYFLNGRRCPKCSLKSFSKAEKSVLKFIKKIYNGKIITNDRRILNGKEIDIHLPKLKVGIEYCGIYWHSELYVDNNYHLDKLNLCKSKGIRLIQIFEDEWINKKNIIKSKIKHILGLNQDLPKIHARKCYIKEIDTGKKNKFLDKYHIQGGDKSSIRLGLFTKINNVRKLVAVMTFSLPRRCLGNKINKENTYELSRFATKRKFNIIGGFSKLLSYFKKNYKFDEIITYADLRYSAFNGNLYEVNGFKLSHQSKPNYWYFYRNNTLYKYHRFNFRKNNLKKLFPKIYMDELTEHEIMLKAKYLRIYDCGTLVYKYKK